MGKTQVLQVQPDSKKLRAMTLYDARECSGTKKKKKKPYNYKLVYIEYDTFTVHTQ